jgi:hypothetical protein
MLAHEFADRILGWTPHGAAENYLAKIPVKMHPYIDPKAPRRIVEEPIRSNGQNALRARRFVLYYGHSPIQEVKVAPYGWWWWTLASSSPLYPVTDLDWAVDHWDTDQEEAIDRLNAVIRNYPNSDASRWASQLLETLTEQGSGGAPRWRAEFWRLREQDANRDRQ